MHTVSGSGPDYIWPTPMLYIANMFQYWRTGFTFTFKFVKTEFHSGRLMVVFSPGNSAIGFTDSRFCYREILDLRESNEFTITIPYTSTLPYQSMGGPGETLGAGSIGSLRIFVLNPLVGPSTVSTGIDCIVEVCADDTFEVAVPRNVFNTPVLYTPGTGAPTLVADEEQVFESQALGEDVQEQGKEATLMHPAPSIAGIRNNDGGIAAAANCVGEKIMSLRSLAKRGLPILNMTANDSLVAFRPKILSFDDCSDNVTVPADYGLDYVSMIGALYNYQRGGLKFTSYNLQASNVRMYLRAGLMPNTLGTTPAIRVLFANQDQFQYNSVSVHTGPDVAGGLYFTIPQYARTHCEMYRLYTSNVHTLPTDIYCSDLRVVVKCNSGSSNIGKIFRQAADDWSCGFFTGCLPIRIVPRTVITTLPVM
jgi:hypothetical protein